MWFELSGDFKSAFRGLRRAPGTSALIVFTLAIAIGAATIGFTFADLALFRGLPVNDASRVVSVFASDTHGSNPRARVSGPDFLDYQARSRTLAEMAVFRDGRAPLIRDGQSQTLTVAYATANLFSVMGQPAVKGRPFAPGDDRPGAAPVLLLAHRYWQESLSSRPDIIGRPMQIGRQIYTVAGVMTPDLEFANIADVDAWLPLHLSPDSPRDARNLRFLARLREATTFDEAAAEMAAIGDALASEYPVTNAGWKVRVIPVSDLIGGEDFWVVIALFLLSIGLLMAIAVANVSNLVMVRAAARARELAVRTALGARGGRLVRQFMAEGLLLSVVAALLAIPIAYAGLQAIAGMSAEAVFRQLTIDPHELAFVAALALICPVLFSLAPIRIITRPDMRQVLASTGGRGTTRAARGRGALVVAQVALAVVLLTASSLALKSVRTIFAAPLGLETSGLLLFTLHFNDVEYREPAQARAAAAATRDALAGVPGVEAAAMVDALPILGDHEMAALTIDEQPAQPTDTRPTANVTAMTADAGRAMGLHLLAGEWWVEGATDRAVVSRAAAVRYLGGVESAIGRRLTFTQGERPRTVTVAGVSSDVAHTDRQSAAPARVWVPLDAGHRRVTYLVKAADPAALGSQARAVVAAHAPAVPIEDLRTFDQALRDAESSDYVVIGMLTGFAVLALLLATTGLFGVVSYAAAQRTAEFGTRMALGASGLDVVRLVARQSLGLLAVGLLAGLAGGIGVGFAMRSALSGMSPADPQVLGGIAALLGAVTLLATAVPAWRASRIDPVVALRAE